MAARAGRRGLWVEVKGVSAFTHAMGDMAQSLGDWTEVHARTARVVASAARASAPRKTGRLAGSITPRPSRFKAGIVSALVYAPPVHWGWPAHHVEAHPFVSLAASRTEPIWVRFYQDEINERLAEVARRCPRGKAS